MFNFLRTRYRWLDSLDRSDHIEHFDYVQLLVTFGTTRGFIVFSGLFNASHCQIITLLALQLTWFPFKCTWEYLLPYIQLEVGTSILWFRSTLPAQSSYVQLFRWYISTRYCRFMGLSASCHLWARFGLEHLIFLMNWVTLQFEPDSWFRGGSFHRTPIFPLVFGDLDVDTPLIFNPLITIRAVYISLIVHLASLNIFTPVPPGTNCF